MAARVPRFVLMAFLMAALLPVPGKVWATGDAPPLPDAAAPVAGDAPAPVDDIPAADLPVPVPAADAPPAGQAPPALSDALADPVPADAPPAPQPESQTVPTAAPSVPGALPPSLAVSQDLLTVDQDNDTVDPLVADQKQMISEVDREVEEMLKGREFIPSTARTLLFTPFQRGLLDTLRQELKRNPPPEIDPAAPAPATGVTPGVITDSEDLTPEEKRISLREISLGGIMYRSEKDWVIWFNNQRITPGTLPESVVGLKVFRNYIELRWLDTKDNKIYPIRLKPNQRFNFDQRVFLPG